MLIHATVHNSALKLNQLFELFANRFEASANWRTHGGIVSPFDPMPLIIAQVWRP